MTTLDQLEALAKAATPGPWEFYEWDDGDFTSMVRDVELATITTPRSYTRSDNRFIAAANPTAILALIALVRQQHESMLAVLCDPEGTPCFDGSNGDREVIAEAIAAFESFGAEK